MNEPTERELPPGWKIRRNPDGVIGVWKDGAFGYAAKPEPDTLAERVLWHLADSLLAAPAAQPPEGYVMVPREPSEAMLQAANDAYKAATQSLASFFPDRCAYRALLAAAAPSQVDNGCTRSHPHELMDESCERKTEAARAAAAERQVDRDALERDAAMSDAARDMLTERQRQISVEGWTPEHDDEHGKGEMAMAAACYSAHSSTWEAIEHGLDSRSGLFQKHVSSTEFVGRMWPWDCGWWKPKDTRSNLVRAGALILAEVERLDRAALARKQGGAA